MNKTPSLKLESNLTYAKHGIINCLLSGITWGMNGVILGYLFTKYPFDDPNLYIQASLIAACIHTGFSSIFILFYNFKNGKIREIGRCLFNKIGLFIMLCALCSGPLAMSGYLLGINMAGASYVSVITSCYPAIGTVLAMIFLKEKLSKRSFIGILLCVLGAIATGFTGEASTTNPSFYLGIFFALIAAVGWGFEGVFSAYIMDIIDPEIAIALRQTFSFIMYMIFVIPLINGFGFLSRAFTFDTTSILVFSGLLCSVSYISWYLGLSTIGVGRAMALNITYPIWVIIIEWFAYGNVPSINLVIGCLIIVSGAILVSGNPKEMIKLRNYKE